MYLDRERANAVSAAVFLIGMGVLFSTGFWWPGIMFLIGIEAIIQGLVQGRGWYGTQGGLWMIGIGLWALCRFNVAVLFVILGVSVLINAFIRPPMLKPKPQVDNTLE